MKMTTMGIASFGPPEVLEAMMLDIPQAGQGTLRIKVKAAGVQPADCLVRKGRIPPGVTVQLPAVLGNEFAGIIDQLGEGVTGFEIGEDVLGFQYLGSYAEYIVVPISQIVSKPTDMPWEVAGGFSGAAQTAHTAIEELKVAKGDVLFINGAAGAVGTVAVQLAKERGAVVIGSASEANHEYLKSLGAVPVLYGENMTESLRLLAPQGIDACLDAAGGEGLFAAVDIANDRSRIGTIIAFAQAEKLGVKEIRSKRNASRLQNLVELYSEGKLHIHIRKVYSLDRAADAHREVETGHGRGKVVLSVD
ncbi:NADP-dependent oxidoreductase [Paenibacillus sabinae]|uniref:Alcohol dehydrogenase zinc-binding domain-containing protein n=1 Tax=Paenibacillus sabinae T27 TaxID=1268072 RepID=X4ZJM9_9BACL|nr:alcohol dehydrogenase zinc-binding domain-containing protein [Paenibacillus sabinae T27]